MRTLVLNQPTFLPWLGYFELISRADIFVVYDSAQFSKQSWHQRNRIRNKAGEILLVVPVSKESHFLPLNEIKLGQDKKQIQKILQTIYHSYNRAPFFQMHYPEIEKIFHTPFEKLLDFNMAFIDYGKKVFGIDNEMIFSSTLDVQGEKVDAIIDVCRKLKAEKYYSPAGARGYIGENNLFPAHSIELEFQNYVPPKYQQLNFADHISHLSFIDYIFNCDDLSLFRK